MSAEMSDVLEKMVQLECWQGREEGGQHETVVRRSGVIQSPCGLSRFFVPGLSLAETAETRAHKGGRGSRMG
jgi:hypothetical protein